MPDREAVGLFVGGVELSGVSEAEVGRGWIMDLIGEVEDKMNDEIVPFSMLTHTTITLQKLQVLVLVLLHRQAERLSIASIYKHQAPLIINNHRTLFFQFHSVAAKAYHRLQPIYASIVGLKDAEARGDK